MVTFTEADLGMVQHPHNDALVVTLKIGEYQVRCYKELGLHQDDLEQPNSPTVKFNGTLTWPLRAINLEVQAGTKKASNNEAEYEALITGLRLAVIKDTDEVVVFCDSQLIVNQTTGKYAARDEKMIDYVKEVVRLLAMFQDCRLQQASRDDNSHANASANLASTMKSGVTRTIMVNYLSGPSMEPLITEYEAMYVEMGPS
ncbi:uncharacterized protein LOC114262149 [Camellia sinensis]|uniref:uncharacterized protein LOC114262149 n=1 Tax=Camellia sinensis TaxID=4442 RepID=UPI001035750C|nr:uncharacterized protein LOC114262149 [Camellia sinensis]